MPPPPPSLGLVLDGAPVCHVVTAPGDALRLPPSLTREERGLVHICRGPLGALADEGLGCRRSLKDVRGFGMRLKVPLGCCDP